MKYDNNNNDNDDGGGGGGGGGRVINWKIENQGKQTIIIL